MNSHSFFSKRISGGQYIKKYMGILLKGMMKFPFKLIGLYKNPTLILT